ncbi:MAG: type III pantothenate kinase [Phycisphaerales bacterium]|nr:type III pantothenate kinase [Phycisphaerales bacterium]
MAVSPVEALLVLDVGNTRVGLARWDDDGLHDAKRVATSNWDSIEGSLGELWERVGAARSRAIVMSSVDPSVAARLAESVVDVCQTESLRIRDDIALPLPLNLPVDDEVGADRVCAAAAAYDRVRGACAVASFGTAITVDVVSAEGEFLGGSIMPGLRLSFEALHEYTAALPLVTAARPESAIGKTTREAILHGVVFGAVGALREHVERYATELGEWPNLTLTGGDAELIAPYADFIDAVAPDLCLSGVALAYRKAAGLR